MKMLMRLIRAWGGMLCLALLAACRGDGSGEPALEIESVVSAPSGLVGRGVGWFWDRAIALLCASDGKGCALYTADFEAGTVEPLSSGEVPEGLEPSGMGGWEHVYVFGNGVARFDGQGWHSLVPPDTGPRFNAFDWGWAAGDQGRLAAVEYAGGWTDVATGTTEDLLDVVHWHEVGAIAVGRKGTVVAVTEGEAYACSTGEDDFVTLVTDPINQAMSFFEAVTESGSLLGGALSKVWPECRRELGVGSILAGATYRCEGVGPYLNWRYLARDRLLGGNGCFLD